MHTGVSGTPSLARPVRCAAPGASTRANLLGTDGVITPHPLPTSDGRTAVELDINDRTRAFLRDTADELTYVPLDNRTPPGRHAGPYRPATNQRLFMPSRSTDATHITLTPDGRSGARIAPILTLIAT